MTGPFPDPTPAKDDSISTPSTAGDSAYMSQPDTARQVAGPAGAFLPQNPQDPRSLEFMPQSMYSPTLSSDSQAGFAGPHGDMGQIILPTSSDPEMGDGSFAMSEFTNYTTSNQMQGRPVAFEYSGQAVPRYFAQSAEVSAGQEQWSNAEVPTFSRPFAVAPIDATSMPMYRPPPYDHQFTQQTFFVPAVHYANSNVSVSSVRSASPLQRQRPRKMASFNAGPSPSPTTAEAAITTFSNGQAEALLRPTASRASSAISQSSVEIQSPSLVSPTTVIAIPQQVVPSHHHHHHHQDSSSSRPQPQVPEKPRSNGPPSVDECEGEGRRPSRSAASRTLSEEAEMKIARSHPLYQAAPQADDLYHCPYEGQPGCQHKPTKLKCNYDKYVDSHLKPFRCKNPQCMNVEFSSTACLLRHEREAHGMHGHGSKPHLCTYLDCERSVLGNGFPRRYNLFDHMKRVHDYTGPTSPNDRASSPGAPKKAGNKKRKSVDAGDDGKEKRSKTKVQVTAPPSPPPHFKRAQEIRNLQNEWSNRRAMLQHRLQALQGPQDIASHQEVSDDVAALHRIAEKLKELG